MEERDDKMDFWVKTDPKKINIDKDDIYYREKYDEIMNYVKSMLMGLTDNEFLKGVRPKGALCVNVGLGTDFQEFIQLICSHYYLELIELKYKNIVKDPNLFKENFNDDIVKLKEKVEKQNEIKQIKAEVEDSKKEKHPSPQKKVLLLIDEKPYLDKYLEENNLLENFVRFYSEGSFLEIGIILIWLNHDYNTLKEMGCELYEKFDMLIKIPSLNEIDKENILNTLQESAENINFDVNVVLNYMKEWEIKDLKQLYQIAKLKYLINPEVNEKSNDITKILINLIQSEEYIPIQPKEENSLTKSKEQKTQEMEKREGSVRKVPIVEQSHADKSENYVKKIKEEGVSDFMLNQLYEDAASKHYNELLIIIDKLEKEEKLEKNDKKLLATYPFILNDNPNKAKIDLEKAKKRIDIIKQAFGK